MLTAPNLLRYIISRPKLRAMHVIILPALQDNYMYLIVDDKSKKCAVVDPVAPSAVLAAVEKHGLHLTSVLTTHHHWDHAGGNKELVTTLAEQNVFVDVYGGSKAVGSLTKCVKMGDTFSVGEDITISCLATPCHTQDHICYHATEAGKTVNDGCVFTGDTLFLGGCGRLFEGTPAEMHHALSDILANLPGPTKVYCGHEYTVKNLQFAMSVDPENVVLKNRLEKCTELRKKGEFTVPGTISEELATNPFLRVTQKYMQVSTNTNNAVDAFRVLRQAKDAY